MVAFLDSVLLVLMLVKYISESIRDIAAPKPLYRSCHFNFRHEASSSGEFVAADSIIFNPHNWLLLLHASGLLLKCNHLSNVSLSL